MGKRGRPPKKKPVPDTVSKAAQCYTIVSSDEDIGKKEETLSLPSPTQRRGAGSERGGTMVITPPERSTPLTDSTEKRSSLTRDCAGKKKIKLNGIHKKDDDDSGDSDATEVYVQSFFSYR
jgi:hypothetical protein